MAYAAEPPATRAAETMAVPTISPATTVAVWRGRRTALRTAMRARIGLRHIARPTAAAAASAEAKRARTQRSIYASGQVRERVTAAAPGLAAAGGPRRPRRA